VTDSTRDDTISGPDAVRPEASAALTRPSRALMLGFGLGLFAVLLTLAVLGWTLHSNYRSVQGQVSQILNQEEPMSAAAHELEINVLGAGLAVLRYVQTGDPVHRARIAKDEADFARFKLVYDELASSERERSLGNRIDLLHDRYSRVGQTLMDLRDQRAALHDQLTAGFDAVDEILDDRIQAGIDHDSSQWEAVLQLSWSIEGDVAEVGTWLGIYLATPRDLYRSRMLDNLQDVAEHMKEFKALPLSPSERALVDQLERRLELVASEIHQILSLDGSLRGGELQFIQLRDEMDEVLDDDIQALSRRQLAEAAIEANDTIRSMRSVSLVLVSLGALVCLLAAAAIVRFFVRLRTAAEDLQSEVDRRRESEGARATLVERLLSAQEEERGRFAKELHDQMGQQLSALVLGLETLRGRLAPESKASIERDLDRLQGIADQLIDDVHFVAWELRPAALDDFGLEGALGNLIESWKDRSSVKIGFYGDLGSRRLSWQIETTVYRVVQEALTNVAKHAEARVASVVLMSLPEEIRLVVEDDGCGFDVEPVLDASHARGSLGVPGMRERLAMAGGTLEIESAPGQGTTLVACIPVGTQSAGEVAA